MEKTPGVAPSVLPPKRAADDIAVECDERGVGTLSGALDGLLQIADDVCLWNCPAYRIGDRPLANDGIRCITLVMDSRGRLSSSDDKRAATRASLAQPFDCLDCSAGVIDDRGLGDFSEERVERRFESFRRADGFGGRGGVGNQLENGAADVFILRFQ